ncbi:MAG: response regulator transcription factor [Actinomycetota bacterium]|nr:response regulator transcription factor [Actinomycetota bacterium]
MRLLVIEDDPALADIIVRAMREEGHAVDREATAADAEVALELNGYDLVLLDIGLPDGDGLLLCRTIRRCGLPTRVMMLTARDSLDDKVRGLDTGADDYLVKPFDTPELSARVRAVLRRPATTGSPTLQVGDIRLDPAAHRAWRDRLLIPLTAREFAMLHYLMARSGQVVSRTELLDHLWDAHYDGLSNVVDVHIASLRRKLGRPDSPLPLDTVRGVGYVLLTGGTTR